MDVKLAEFKRKLLETGLFEKVSREGQYRCKVCPYCGDAKSHLYVLIRQNDDIPVLCNCFKCNHKGLIDEKFLDYFGIDDMDIPKVKGRKRIRPGVANTMIDVLNTDTDSETIQIASDYIEYRLGVRPTFDDLKKFMVIGNPTEYVTAYLDGETWGLKDRVWFMMNNGSIVGRSLDDNVNVRWRKRTVPGTMAGLYSIKQPIAIDKPVNVCICEGVMDAIGLYYHGNIPNAVFIATMGSRYEAGIHYAIDAGIFGDSVNIRIYKDADIERVMINKRLSPLFKSISVYRNTLAKDYGVPMDKIEIEKCF